MIMTALANETFMNYEFIYYTEKELELLLMELHRLENYHLVKQIDVIPGWYRDNAIGGVFACLNCNVVDSLYNRLNTLCPTVSKEVRTIYDDYISLNN